MFTVLWYVCAYKYLWCDVTVSFRLLCNTDNKSQIHNFCILFLPFGYEWIHMHIQCMCSRPWASSTQDKSFGWLGLGVCVWRGGWESWDHMSTCLHSVKRQHMMQRADITSTGISDLQSVTLPSPNHPGKWKTHQGQSSGKVHVCKNFKN